MNQPGEDFLTHANYEFGSPGEGKEIIYGSYCRYEGSV